MKFKLQPTSRTGSPSCSNPSRKSVLAVLTLLLIIALVLRLYRLEDGLWWDEIFMYIKFVKMPLGELLTTYESENQHFLYILLARASIWIFGDTVWSLRFPAVLFGVGSIWAIYLLGRQVSDEWEALSSAALLTFSYQHIWFSQNARGYIGLLFWTILGSWFFLQAMGDGRLKWWVLYGMAAALGIYTQMLMLFVIAGHFIVYILSLRGRQMRAGSKGWAGLLIGFSLVGLLSLLLYGLVLPQVISYMLAIESTVAVWKNPLWTFAEFGRVMEISFAGGVGATVALLLFAAGLFSFARTQPVVVQLLIIPALICAAVVIGVRHHLWPRYFIFTMGFATLVLVRGAMVVGGMVTRMMKLPSRQFIPIGTALCVGLILISAISAPSAYGPKQDYLGALAFVETNKEPGDVVVTAGWAFFPYQKLYHRDWQSVESLQNLNTIRSNAKRTWLLHTLSPKLETDFPEIMASIRKDFKVMKEFPGTLGGGTIFVRRSDTPPSDRGKLTAQETSLSRTH